MSLSDDRFMLCRFAIRLLGLLLVGLYAATPAWAAGDRVALVIGNGAYQHTADLPNPKNDARDMAAALRQLGFDVDLQLDVDLRGMDDAVRRFGDRRAGAQAGVIFYAGHGLQVGGRNYLMPTDAKLAKERDLNYEVIDLAKVLFETERTAGVNVIILDACRDNPLARNLAGRMSRTRAALIGRGLAPVEGAVGTLIAYATKDGALAADGTGRNSPYTKALLKWIATPGLEVGLMFRRVRETVLASTSGEQVPWEYGSLTGEFYFGAPAVARRPTTSATQTALLTPPPVPSEPELEPVEAEYVAVRNANVRDAPSVRSSKVTLLSQGTTVHVAGKVKGENWYLIERGDERLGYVFGDLLKNAETVRQEEDARRRQAERAHADEAARTAASRKPPATVEVASPPAPLTMTPRTADTPSAATGQTIARLTEPTSIDDMAKSSKPKPKPDATGPSRNGRWVGEAKAGFGPCGTYKLDLTVSDGKLVGQAKAGGEQYSLNGSVSDDGKVAFFVTGGQGQARGKGKIKGQKAKGSWKSGSECSGSFTLKKVS
jgi:hypothetical protein